MAFFDFLHDDLAPTPLEMVGGAARSACQSVKDSVNAARERPYARVLTAAAKTGLVVGVAIAVPVMVVRLGEKLVDKATN